MAEIKQLTGDMTLRVMYPEVNKNITNVNAEIVGHKASGQAHAADAITYNGNVPAASVKEAIDKTDQRISTIVAQAGDSNTEIVDARGGAPVLGERLNRLDAQLADTDQRRRFESMVNRKEPQGLYFTWVDDDGNKGFYTKLYPLAREYGISVTSALITNNLYSSTMLTDEEREEMHQSGLVEFLSHTHYHDNNNRPINMSEEELDYDFRTSQQIIKERG